MRPYAINVLYFLEKYEEMHEYDSMIAKCSKPIHFENKTITINHKVVTVTNENNEVHAKTKTITKSKTKNGRPSTI